MPSLVYDLQKKALDENVNISTLLRYALLVSKKLNINDFENWISSELNGYGDTKIPKYRIHKGEFVAHDINYDRYIPVIIDSSDKIQIFTKYEFNSSLSELNLLIDEKNESHIYMALNPNVESYLRNLTGYEFKFILAISKCKVQNISEIVRNRILDWSLDLEKDGILGKDMTFTDKEKRIATSKHYTNNYFYGDIKNSQIQQNSDNCAQSF